MNSIFELQHGNLVHIPRGEVDLGGALPGYFDRNADHDKTWLMIVEPAMKKSYTM